ncbi:TonB-dependent receptor [Thauera sinica]|uniref:TonB-dependent siderophore receptor n=1 Tax=Thauera sinica TaxID=2665146 RepID=A0ABW1AQP7_9RHOO|nr:TonB-dependent receptor [Thauera sp. K11]
MKSQHMGRFAGIRASRIAAPPAAIRAAIEAMAMSAALGIIVASPAVAAEPAAAMVQRQYAIGAGELGDVLAQYAATAGVQLVFDPAALAGRRSPGLQGRYGVREGFEQLLRGSGYQLVKQGNDAYSLHKAPAAPVPAAAAEPRVAQLAEVRVTASGEAAGELPRPYAGGKVARGGRVGMLGNKDVMDTPFSQTSYTAEFIADRQARTLSDVMSSDPSVAIDNPSASGWEATVIRGFSTGDGTSSVSLNGLYGILPADATGIGMAERVEVLKGPSALLNGMPTADAVGGTVNLVSKRAPYEPLAQITVSHASRSQPGVSADIGRRFGEDRAFGVRFNGTWRDGGLSVDPTKEKMVSGVLGLDYQGEGVRLSADFGHQERDLSSANRPLFLGAGVRIPKLPRNDESYLPPWTIWNGGSTFGMVQAEWDIAEGITAYAAYGMRKTDGKEVLFINPVLLDAEGDWEATPSRSASASQTRSATAGLRFAADTGPVRHAIAVNAARITEDADYAQLWGSDFEFTSNLYHPVHVPEPALVVGDLRPSSVAKRSSFGIADTLSMFGDRLQITVGTRRQSVSSKNISIATGAVTSSYESHVWSPAVGVIVKPRDGVSIYANYIEGLRPGTVVGETYANAGQIFPPYRSKQYEAGVKVDWSGNLITTVSAFQIAQPNTVTIPGVPLPALALNGEQRNRGLEFSMFGQPWNGVRLTGGLMVIDAELRKTEGGADDGNQAPAVPKWQATLGGEWDTGLVPGLTLTARVKHSEMAYIDTANARSVPSWTLLDVGARYRFTSLWNEPAVLRLTIENALDKNFWISRTYGVYQSTPRTVLLSATFDF